MRTRPMALEAGENEDPHAIYILALGARRESLKPAMASLEVELQDLDLEDLRKVSQQTIERAKLQAIAASEQAAAAASNAATAATNAAKAITTPPQNPSNAQF